MESTIGVVYRTDAPNRLGEGKFIEGVESYEFNSPTLTVHFFDGRTETHEDVLFVRTWTKKADAAE